MESDPLAQELGVEDRVLLVFGYLGPLALVTLIASRRELVKWHAKQGLVLALALASLYLFVYRPIYFVLNSFWGALGDLVDAGAGLVVIGVLTLTLVCIVRGLEGERFRIPMLGELVDWL